MSGGQGLRWLALAALAAAGCGGVAEQPGNDFELRVLDEMPIRVVGQIYAPVRFAVEGCAEFELALEDPSGTRHPLPFTKQSDGSYEASVPTAWVRTGKCADAWHQGNVAYFYSDLADGTLVTTCHDAGRSASAGISLVNSLEFGGISDLGVVRAVFPGGWALASPRWISTSEVEGAISLDYGRTLTGEWAPQLDPGAYLNPMVRPRLVTSGDRAFATLGCEGRPCPPVSIGPGETVPGERLAEIALADGQRTPPRAVAHVSTNVVDMAFAKDGSLVVVSDTGIARRGDGTLAWEEERWGETVVWRVLPAPQGSTGVVEDAAAVIARFPNETVVSRLSRTASGALVFATVSTVSSPRAADHSGDVNLHLTDGSSVATTYTAPVPEFCDVSKDWACNWLLGFVNTGIYLSPDGAALILTEPGDDWLYWMNTDPADRAWQPFGKQGYPIPISGVLRHRLFYSSTNGGAAWLPGAVALWSGGDLLSPNPSYAGIVQVFDLAPARVLRYEYVVEPLPGATVTPVLVGVSSVRDHLVLTTSTGVRILDAAGKLVGGMDPFPCGAHTTSVAEPIGDSAVGVGMGSTVHRFTVRP